ncbi:MAG: leucyl aminopeptidase [Parachlamydia sp.]|nr:leucyl aminopeptidase [Parachlamydia sp.]
MMRFAAAPHVEKRPVAEVVVLPCFQEKGHARPVLEVRSLQPYTTAPLTLKDFTGKEGELLYVYTKDQPEKRLVLLGLGAREKVTTETLRRAYASFAKSCHPRKIKMANLIVPEVQELSPESVLRGILEGILLANYRFDKLKAESNHATVLLQKICLVGVNKSVLPLAVKHASICEGVYLVRDLANSNADEVTPQYLIQAAQKLAKRESAVKVTVFNKARLIKEKMGLILAVGRASQNEPAMIFLEYNGLPKGLSKHGAKEKDHTVLVGKGITYDTGGLNLKSSGMETMKCDMAGAAVVLAVISVASALKLPIHLTAILATAENCISSSSYKPGDVYKGYTGKTVEITNTDAEGRLVLADALAYAAKKLKPTRIVDVATLTGGVDVALGNEATGLMSNNDALADLLIRAGSETFERVWRLPMHEEYRDLLKSDVADLKNAAGRSASPITAATFLKDFINDIPWAHLDIASTAFLSEAKRYHPKFATGVGVRLLIEFLEHL